MYHWFTINISWLTLSWIDVETSMFGAITLLINSFEKSLWQTCNCKIQSSLMYLLIIHWNWVEERGGTNCYKFLTIFILHHQCNDTSRWKGFPQFLTQVSRTIRVNKVVLWLFPTAFCSLVMIIICMRKMRMCVRVKIMMSSPSLDSLDGLAWPLLVGIDDITDLKDIINEDLVLWTMKSFYGGE